MEIGGVVNNNLHQNQNQNRISDKQNGIDAYLDLVSTKYYDKYIKKDMLNNIGDERIQNLISKSILVRLPPEGISKEVWDTIPYN